MPTINIGTTAIDYTLERRPHTRLRKIIVTPDEVRVLAPADDEDADVVDFIGRKRAWLYANYKSVAEIAERRPRTLRFMTGSKVPYRGRMMRLTVNRGDIRCPEIAYRNGILVTVPRELSVKDWDAEIWAALRTWYFERAREDCRRSAASLSKAFGLEPRRIVLREMQTAWGACGRTGLIHLDWRLILAPAAVLRYAVAHELAHLRCRSHSPEFWDLVGRLQPNYQEAKAWLDASPPILHFEPAPDLRETVR